MDYVKEILGNDYYYHHSSNEKPGTTIFKLHTHNAYEIFLFLSGNASFIIEGNYYKLDPWDFIFVKPGEFHRVAVESDMTYERMIIRFDYSFLKPIDPANVLMIPFDNNSNNIIKGSTIKETLIPQIYGKIDELLAEDSDIQGVAMLSFVSQLFLEITKLHKKGLIAELVPKPNRKISDIINYISENLTQDLSLESISKQFFISKFYLIRLFKENTGSTIGNFILKKKLLFAQRLISGGATPSSACFSSGFSDYSAFYKSYKKYLGISPSKATNSPNNKLIL